MPDTSNRPQNVLKEKMRNDETILGMFVLTGSPLVVEAATYSNLDFIVIDAEASPITNESLLHLLQAGKGSRVETVVRVPELNRHTIEHILDLGTKTIIVPKVNNAEMAREITDIIYYPPDGNRGINPVRASNYFTNLKTYFSSANGNTLCFVQIETVEALENVDEIAGVDGIDGLFIGPGDLAASLGQIGDVTGSKMEEARQKVITAARKHGKFLGIFAYSMDLAKQHIQEGFQFVAVGNDIKILSEAINAKVNDLTTS